MFAKIDPSLSYTNSTTSKDVSYDIDVQSSDIILSKSFVDVVCLGVWYSPTCGWVPAHFRHLYMAWPRLEMKLRLLGVE